jgi:hypothetical protein
MSLHLRWFLMSNSALRFMLGLSRWLQDEWIMKKSLEADIINSSICLFIFVASSHLLNWRFHGLCFILSRGTKCEDYARQIVTPFNSIDTTFINLFCLLLHWSYSLPVCRGGGNRAIPTGAPAPARRVRQIPGATLRGTYPWVDQIK